jgi:hypothetical protein
MHHRVRNEEEIEIIGFVPNRCDYFLTHAAKFEKRGSLPSAIVLL